MAENIIYVTDLVVLLMITRYQLTEARIKMKICPTVNSLEKMEQTGFIGMG